MRAPFPHRVSQLLQERLPELVAEQVSKCFEDNMPQLAVDAEKSKQQRKVFTMPRRCCQCGGSWGRSESSLFPVSEQGGYAASSREL